MSRYQEDHRLATAPCGEYNMCDSLIDDEGTESHFECGCTENLDPDGNRVRMMDHRTKARKGGLT